MLERKQAMKEIKAIIQPHMLSRVMSALHESVHFPGATVSDCTGHGRGRGADGRFIATVETIYPASKVRIEVLCADQQCNALVDLIRNAARTGNPGDGVITVADLDRVIRIRTGEAQESAV
jgi:nitrogen regulatory protein P-II 1